VTKATPTQPAEVVLPEGEAFVRNISGHVSAIQLCLTNHFRLPALALIYCGIDFMSNLSRPVGQAQQTRGDFIRWSEAYMRCKERLRVSGLDLYGARCGILHAYIADSQLSADGKARPIIYAWGNKSVEGPNKFLKGIKHPAIMVRIEDLASAFSEGVDALEAVLQNQVSVSLIQERSKKLFLDQGWFPEAD
jgi:hypothetical protein